MVGSCAFATATRADVSDRLDRQISVAEFDVLAVDSFFQRRVQRDALNDRQRELSLWGIEAQSSLPLLQSAAQLDYSVFLPSDNGVQTFADVDHQLMKLSVRDRYRFVTFGGSLFNVGNAFLNQPLASERLMSVGLSMPGQGTEVWARGNLPFLRLQPTIRHIDVADELANGDGERTSSTTTLGLSSPVPTGRIYLRNVRFEEQPGNDLSPISRTRWELGGSITPFGDISLAPLFAVEQQFDATNLRRESSIAGLNVNTHLADATVLQLNLHHDRHQFPLEQAARHSLAANLTITRPLRLWSRTPPGLTVSAAVGYRELRGFLQATPDEGMSVRLSFNYHVGG